MASLALSLISDECSICIWNLRDFSKDLRDFSLNLIDFCWIWSLIEAYHYLFGDALKIGNGLHGLLNESAKKRGQFCFIVKVHSHRWDKQPKGRKIRFYGRNFMN